MAERDEKPRTHDFCGDKGPTPPLGSHGTRTETKPLPKFALPVKGSAAIGKSSASQAGTRRFLKLRCDRTRAFWLPGFLGTLPAHRETPPSVLWKHMLFTDEGKSFELIEAAQRCVLVVKACSGGLFRKPQDTCAEGKGRRADEGLELGLA